MIVEIRKVRKRDLPYLRQIFLSVRQETFTWENPKSFLADDFDKETDGESIIVFVSDNSIVGFISVWEPDNFVHHLYVLPEYQNKGIGKRLLKTALTKLKKPITLKCITKNLEALNFYKRLGWKSIRSGADSKGKYLLLQSE